VPGTPRVIKLYQPWPAPVLAACYREPSVLPEIERWVGTLREQGRVAPDVRFGTRRRGDALVGVLRSLAGECELLRGGFLVFGRAGLQVLDERSFFLLYHEPD
jgi:hypothetical protein